MNNRVIDGVWLWGIDLVCPLVKYRPISPATSPQSNFWPAFVFQLHGLLKKTVVWWNLLTPIKKIPGSLPRTVIIQHPFSITILIYRSPWYFISHCFNCKEKKSRFRTHPLAYSFKHKWSMEYRQSKLNLKKWKLNKEHYCCIISYLRSISKSLYKSCKPKRTGQIEKTPSYHFQKKKKNIIWNHGTLFIAVPWGIQRNPRLEWGKICYVSTNCLLLGLDATLLVPNNNGGPRLGLFRHSNPSLGETLLHFLLCTLTRPSQSAKVTISTMHFFFSSFMQA